jgi:hypothetical protein
MRRRLALIVATSLSLLLASTGSALAAKAQRQVIMLDNCDGPSFNAALGPGACSRNGGLTFEALIEKLAAHQPPASWRNSPGQLSLPAGGSIDAVNHGGEFHTFTKVAAFGPGCVPDINALLGLGAPIPECGNPALFGTTGAAPGQSVNTGPLAAGTHFFECLIHPWMRTTVRAG